MSPSEKLQLLLGMAYANKVLHRGNAVETATEFAEAMKDPAFSAVAHAKLKAVDRDDLCARDVVSKVARDFLKSVLGS